MPAWIIIAAGAQLLSLGTKAATSHASVKGTLIAIEHRIGEANLNCDYRYFAQVEADEFIFTGNDGSVTSKAQDLAGEASCKKSSSSYELDETKVWVNRMTAVVTGRVTIRAAMSLSAVSRSRFTDVFVFRDGRWQLVAGHSSRIREATSQPASSLGAPASLTH
jgi:hypothetical protein